MTAEIEVEIATLAAQGDGIAETPAGPLFVPYVLPGERVRIRPEGEGRAALVAVLEASSDRVAAPCRHFTVCGGCALQHMAPPAYAAWKRAQVEAALRPRGLVADIDALVPALPQSRRRATFAATRSRKTLTLGYHEKASHTIVPVLECPLVVPEIERALPALGVLIGHGLSRNARASLLVTATASGLDVAVTGGKALDGPLRAELAKQSAIADLARLSWDGEIVAERRPPLIDLSGMTVIPPPGAFRQPTAEGEAALVRLVREGVGDAGRAADLFAGCGTFTAALAPQAAIHAVESEAAPLAALTRAVREQGPALRFKPVTTETRDLMRRPLLAVEMKAFDAVVFDPPRAGAAAQAAELAKSVVPVVVAVSCSPATFARDARTLIDGGYRLTRLTPVDQFLWSPHIELVGIFARD
ncbi:class I SAM-dependent RNA methyltransferase [Parvibaculum sp.]|uniref:class I SAM-dependent RNA methyltransferase n=1 Tax=Parvibaculum sp. TaxID=2024848 RepID=UPI00349FE5E2